MKLHHIFILSVFTNCFLLADEATGQAALVDPGSGDARTMATVARLLADNGYTLSAVLLTHGHYDHIMGVPAVLAAYPGIPVYLHAADFQGGDPRLFPLQALLGENAGALRFWSDGDVIRVGELEVKVLHTPGHTPGSVCLLCGDTLLSGDTLFQESMGRTDFPGGSDSGIMASLRRLAALPGDLQVYPGHEEFTTLEHERQYNPYMKAALRAAP